MDVYTFAVVLGLWPPWIPSRKCKGFLILLKNLLYGLIGIFAAVLLLMHSVLDVNDLHHFSYIVYIFETAGHAACTVGAWFLSGTQHGRVELILRRIDKIPKISTRKRGLATLSTLWILVTVLVFCYFGTYQWEWYMRSFANNASLAISAIMFRSLTLAVPMTVLHVFANLCYVVGESFNRLIRTAEVTLESKSDTKSKDMEVLKNDYCYLLNLALDINSAFSVQLLTILACYTFCLIQNAFALMILLQHASPEPLVWLMLRVAECGIHILLSLCAADYLREKAEAFQQAMKFYLLNHSSPENEEILRKVQLIAGIDISKEIQTSAGGIFPVSKSIIPSVVGTFLTYWVILLQFYYGASECKHPN